MKALFIILSVHTGDSIGAVSCNIWLQLNLPSLLPWAQGHRALHPWTHTYLYTHTPLGCDAHWLQSDFTLWLCAVPCIECVCLYICWRYTVCVVMPVVRHQAVTGSAVCRLIVQHYHIPSVPPVHSRPRSRTQPLLHHCPLAETPESSQNQ